MDCSLCPWGFSRQEYWSGLPCLPAGDLPNLGIKSRSPTLQADSLLSEPPGKPTWKWTGWKNNKLFHAIPQGSTDPEKGDKETMDARGCQRGGEKQARGSKNCKRPVAKHTRHGYERYSVGNIGSKYVNLWMVTCVVVSHMVTRLITVITLKCTEISLRCLTGTEAGPLYFKTNRLTERSVLCLQEAGAGWGDGELDESSEEPDLQLRDHVRGAQGTMWWTRLTLLYVIYESSLSSEPWSSHTQTFFPVSLTLYLSCDNGCSLNVCQIIMLYASNFYSAIYQLYLNKTGRK